MPSKKLLIVGTGIKTLSHLTRESECSIKQAQKVLYLVNEPIIKEWIIKNSEDSFSLEDLYFSKKFRAKSYQEITEKIVSTLDAFDNVCVVVYGHPLLLSNAIHSVIKKLDKSDVAITVLPAISSLDCLFADLRVDPVGGCYSIDATELLVYEKPICISNHVIIWQIGLVGLLGNTTEKQNVVAITMLKEKLLLLYGPDHDIILYEAAIYPHLQPKINKITIKDIHEKLMSSITTAYISPKIQNSINFDRLIQLGIHYDDL